MERDQKSTHDNSKTKEKVNTLSNKKYNTIQYKDRKELIIRVTKNNQKLTEVSEELNIKLSTAKFIIKSYKKYGRVFKKKCLDDKKAQNSIDQFESESQKNSQYSSSKGNQPSVIYYPYYIYVPIYICKDGTQENNNFMNDQFYSYHKG